MQGSQGERIFFHYPRLQTMAGAEEAAIPLDGKHQGRTGAGAAQGTVPGAAGYRSAGWGACALLSELPAGGECAGVSSAASQQSQRGQRVTMKITIQGQDYTAALDAARPLTIERKLNEPSICQLWLSLPANGSLATPSAQPVAGGDGRRRHHLLHGLHRGNSAAGVCRAGDRGAALPDCDPGRERRAAAGPIADAAQHGRNGRDRRGADDRAGNAHRIGGALYSRGFR